MNKCFHKLIGSDLERGFLSCRFLVCVLGTALIVVIGAWDKFNITQEMRETGITAGYHFQLVLSALKSEAAAIAIPVLSTLPLSGVYLEEHRTRFEKLYLPRCSRLSYVISKVLATALCGGAGILSGIILITGLLALVFSPMELSSAGAAWELFVQLLKTAFIAALLGMLWASLGAFLGIVNLNFYMAYGGPFIVNYLLIILFSRYFSGIYTLNPKEWMLLQNYHSDNPAGLLFLLFELCIIVMLLEGIAIWKKIE